MPILEDIANYYGTIQADKLREAQADMQQRQFEQQTQLQDQQIRLNDMRMQAMQADALRTKQEAELFRNYNPEEHGPEYWINSGKPEIAKSVEESKRMYRGANKDQRKKVEDFYDFVGEEVISIQQIEDPMDRWKAFQKSIQDVQKTYPNLGADAFKDITPQNLDIKLDKMLARSELGQKLIMEEKKALSKSKKGGKITKPGEASRFDVDVIKPAIKRDPVLGEKGKWNVGFSDDDYDRIAKGVADRAKALQAEARDNGEYLDESTAQNMALDEYKNSIDEWSEEDSFGLGRSIKSNAKIFKPSETEAATTKSTVKEVIREYKDRRAVFDRETKEFLRWDD